MTVTNRELAPTLDVADPPEETLKKVLAAFAFAPMRPKPVVPVHTSDNAAGMSFENFKRMLKPYQKSSPVPIATLWEQDPRRLLVADVQMRPDKPRPLFTENDGTFVNSYRPPDHTASGGTVQPWIDFLDHLVPDSFEAQYVERWTAHKLRRPDIPGPGIMMVAGNDTFGTGRGTFFSILQHLFGAGYCSSKRFRELAGKTGQSQYTDWMETSLIVTVNEVKETVGAGSYAAGASAYELLKEFIDPASRRLDMVRKGIGNGNGLTFASFILATNHRDALVIPPGDRRLFVCENGAPMADTLRKSVNVWMSQPENIAALARYLGDLDLGDFDPFAPPPMTDAKREMADFGHSDLDRAIDDALDGMEGEAFSLDHVIRGIDRLLHTSTYGLADGWQAIARNQLRRTLHRIGRHKGQNWQPTVDGRRCAVYARTKPVAKKWTDKSPDHLACELRKNI